MKVQVTPSPEKRKEPGGLGRKGQKFKDKEVGGGRVAGENGNLRIWGGGNFRGRKPILQCCLSRNEIWREKLCVDLRQRGPSMA